jgi:hypothetical protein
MKKVVAEDVTTAQLDTLFKSLSTRSEVIDKRPRYNPTEHKDKTRSTIALFFVRGYLVLLGIIFLLVLTYNFLLIKFAPGTDLLDVTDIMLLITGSVGSPLGFVVGYYFKGQEEK